jgi:hypothetical protein
MAGQELARFPRQSAVERELRPAVRDEAVFVRHRDFRQRLGVHRVCRLDDFGLGQDVGDHRIDIIVLERAGRAEWHCPLDVVEQCRRIWPIAFDRFDRSLRGKRATATEESIPADAFLRIALQLIAVTGRAGICVYLGTGRCGAAARRKSAAIGRNRIILCELGGIDFGAEAVTWRRTLCDHGGGQDGNEESARANPFRIRREHWRHPPFR